MYYKRDKGKIIEDVAPKLYPKLLESNKTGVMTVFSDVNTNRDFEFDEVLKQKGTYQAAIWLESVYVGTKLSLQQKVTEVDVELQQKEKGPSSGTVLAGRTIPSCVLSEPLSRRC